MATNSRFQVIVLGCEHHHCGGAFLHCVASATVATEAAPGPSCRFLGRIGGCHWAAQSTTAIASSSLGMCRTSTVSWGSSGYDQKTQAGDQNGYRRPPASPAAHWVLAPPTPSSRYGQLLGRLGVGKRIRGQHRRSGRGGGFSAGVRVLDVVELQAHPARKNTLSRARIVRGMCLSLGF